MKLKHLNYIENMRVDYKIFFIYCAGINPPMINKYLFIIVGCLPIRF
jgi:hypothetical protein